MQAAKEGSSVGAASAAAAAAPTTVKDATTEADILSLYGIDAASESKRTLQVSHSLGGDSVVSIVSSPPTVATLGASPVRESVPLETKEARACVAKVATETDLAVATKDWLVICIHI